MAETIQKQIVTKALLLFEQSSPLTENAVHLLRELTAADVLKDFFKDFSVKFVCSYMDGECGAISFLDRKFNKLFTVVYEEPGTGRVGWIPKSL